MIERITINDMVTSFIAKQIIRMQNEDKYTFEVASNHLIGYLDCMTELHHITPSQYSSYYSSFYILSR